MPVTITLKKVFRGTELNITDEGVPDMIPAEACYLGWQESPNAPCWPRPWRPLVGARAAQRRSGFRRDAM